VNPVTPVSAGAYGSEALPSTPGLDVTLDDRYKLSKCRSTATAAQGRSWRIGIKAVLLFVRVIDLSFGYD